MSLLLKVAFSPTVFGFQSTTLGPTTTTPSRCHWGTPARYLLLANRDFATVTVVSNALLPLGPLLVVSILVTRLVPLLPLGASVAGVNTHIGRILQ